MEEGLQALRVFLPCSLLVISNVLIWRVCESQLPFPHLPTPTPLGKMRSCARLEWVRWCPDSRGSNKKKEKQPRKEAIVFNETTLWQHRNAGSWSSHLAPQEIHFQVLLPWAWKTKKSDKEKETYLKRWSEADCSLSRCVFPISSRVQDHIWRVLLVLLTTRRHSANQHWLRVTGHDSYIIKPLQHQPVQPEFIWKADWGGGGDEVSSRWLLNFCCTLTWF